MRYSSKNDKRITIDDSSYATVNQSAYFFGCCFAILELIDGCQFYSADVAQLVEQWFCKPQAGGSSPFVGFMYKPKITSGMGF